MKSEISRLQLEMKNMKKDMQENEVEEMKEDMRKMKKKRE